MKPTNEECNIITRVVLFEKFHKIIIQKYPNWRIASQITFGSKERVLADRGFKELTYHWKYRTENMKKIYPHILAHYNITAVKEIVISLNSLYHFSGHRQVQVFYK